MVQKIHLNSLLNAVIMLLGHYAWSFCKWVVMLENLKVIKQCPLRFGINNCLKATIKYGKELKSYWK